MNISSRHRSHGTFRALVTLAHKLGVKVAAGTDAPLVPFGQMAMEMVTYVVDSGLTPM
jgi:imidazolonepropionase-like amidohydrolase